MMKRPVTSCTLAALLNGGLIAASLAQARLPPPPPLPPPSPAYLSPGSAESLRDGYLDSPRASWRNISPEQRDAIRRLSEEERQALVSRGGNRNGEAVQPGGRLSIDERRQLREQIRAEHEHRGPRSGGGMRP
jgi:hypothetical protein